MTNKKNIALLTIGLVLLLGVVLVVQRSRRGTPQEKRLTKVSVRLAWIPGATFTGDYVALTKGFWQEEGLDVMLNPGGFQFDAIKLVAGGADTFGITSGPQLLQARANGVPIVAIGAVIPRSPIGWVSKKNSGIREPKDFKGRKIGAQFGTHTEITLEALCAKLKIPLTSFERVPVQFDPRPFVAGAVDVLPVYLIDQPVDLRRQGLELNLIDPGDYGVSIAFGNLYFTTEETLKTKPDLVRAFLRGAKRGWLWVNEHPEEAVDILAGFVSNPDRGALLDKLKATLDFVKKGRSGYEGVFPMEIGGWQATYDILIRYGNLQPKLNVAECFTNDYLYVSK